jgi:hypothetical protein
MTRAEPATPLAYHRAMKTLAAGFARDARSQGRVNDASAYDHQARCYQAAIDALCRQRHDLGAAILASIIGLAAGAVLALLVVGALP